MIRKLVIISLIFFIAGCSVWNNFSTYFNRYYNAQKFFDEAEKAIEEETEELFVFKFKRPPSKALDPLNKVIEKCSKIMQFNKESAYFEDALLMTGKSFYYQLNFIKAQRKFKELFTRNDPDYTLEAKLWIGKTDLHLRNFEIGLKTLGEVRDTAIYIDEEEIAVDAFITEISYWKHEEEIERAVQLCEQLIDISSSDELNAEITFETGKMYEEIGDSENALNSYERVLEFDPTFEVEFKSKLGIAVLTRELGDSETSLELLDELRDEDKYVDFLDQVELEMGLNYLAKDNVEEALDKFTLVDTTYKSSPSAGMASYMKAKVLEDQIHDYDSALVFYEKVSSRKVPDEIRNESKSKSKLLKRYVELSDDLKKNEKQYLYATDSMAFVRDSVEYEDWRYLDSLKRAEKQEERSQSGGGRTSSRSTSMAASSGNTIKRLPPQKPKLSADSLSVLIAKNKYQLGNLFFAELDVADSSEHYYNAVLEEYPDSLFTGTQLYSLASYFNSVGRNQLADSLFRRVYNEYTGQEVAVEAAKKLGIKTEETEVDPAAVAFREAEKKYLDSNYTDAINEFFNLVDKYPESEYAPKSLYTVGFILENEMELLDSAAVVYDSLTTNYKTTKYSREVFSKVRFYNTEIEKRQQEEQARLDSIKMANAPKLDSLDAVSDSLGISDTTLNKTQIDSLKAIQKESKIDSSDSTNLRKEMLQKEGLEKEDSTGKISDEEKEFLERLKNRNLKKEEPELQNKKESQKKLKKKENLEEPENKKQKEEPKKKEK